MQVTFCGAAGTVTGSMHLVEVNGKRILLDCGLYQGRRDDSNRRNREFPFDPKSIDVVVLSHAHIDHSGNLPGLVKQGFEGPVYATSATRDLCAVMLLDSAHIQAMDARWYNKKAKKNGEEPIAPLYGVEDALETMTRFVTINYEMKLPLTDGVSVTLRDAGHVLGSASVTLDCRENGSTKRLIFSGDVGRTETPILRDPVPAQNADVLLLESTYGNRDHEPYAETGERLAKIIGRTYQRRGKVIIPTFALERAQEVVYALKRLLEERRIPQLPVFVDSPLTFDITQIFRLHPECFDQEIAALYIKKDSPFYFPGLTYVRRTEESKALNARKEPMIIMSASGMCEAGRILHHLRNNIEDPNNTILFVGYQAENTLGRRILDRQEEVRIFGQPHKLRAEVAKLNSLSAHADRGGLAHWAEPSKESCGQIFLVHGEEKQSRPFQDYLQERQFRGVRIAGAGETVSV